MDVLLVISLLLMPPNPDIVEKLKQEGLWNYTVNIIEDARKRGMDAPDVRLQEKTKGEILKARKNKTKVIKKAVVILADFSDNPGSTPPAHYDSLSMGQASRALLVLYKWPVWYGAMAKQRSEDGLRRCHCSRLSH